MFILHPQSQKINLTVHNLGHTQKRRRWEGNNSMTSTLREQKEDFSPLLHLFPYSTSHKQVGLSVWLRHSKRDHAEARTEHIPYSSPKVYNSQPLWLLTGFQELKIVRSLSKNFRAWFAKWSATLIRTKLCMDVSACWLKHCAPSHEPELYITPIRCQEASTPSMKHQNSSQCSKL